MISPISVGEHHSMETSDPPKRNHQEVSKQSVEISSIPDGLLEILRQTTFTENEDVADYDQFLEEHFQQDPETIKEFRFSFFFKLAAQVYMSEKDALNKAKYCKVTLILFLL